MAAILTGRVMAQQPLHPFFTSRRGEDLASHEHSTASYGQDRSGASVSTKSANQDAETDLEQDPNQCRRKRRRTNSPEPAQLSLDSTGSQGKQTKHQDLLDDHEPNHTVETRHDLLPHDAHKSTHQYPPTLNVKLDGAQDIAGKPIQHTAPKEVMKIGADGRLKPLESQAQPDTAIRRKSRKRRSDVKNGKHLSIRYGRTPHERLALGRRIEQILSGKLRIELEGLPPRTAEHQKVPAEPTDPVKTSQSKATHPFFLGKTQKSPVGAVDCPSDSKVSAQGAQERTQTSRPQAPAFPAGFGFSFANKLKQPGSIEAPWPPTALQHVRGLDPALLEHNDATLFTQERSELKAKGRKAFVPFGEEVYSPLLKLVQALRDGDVYSCKSLGQGGGITAPQRSLATGDQLQTELGQQLKSTSTEHATANANLGGDDANDMSDHGIDGHLTAATAHLFSKVQTSQSAFDRFDCDSVDWCHKYAPKSAEQLLHNQDEVGLLRDWVRMLNIDQVDTGSKAAQNKISAAKQLAAKRRKRKIKDELDDFIVSSADESAYASEALEEDGDNSFDSLSSHVKSEKQPQLKRLRRGGLASTQAVLLSGPHGCGKSATVYAVANELGFEVFEVNSGTRRNGRDVMDRVGDMTRNHLVRNDGPSEISSLDGVVPETTDEGPTDSKQQSVKSFFAAKQPGGSERSAKMLKESKKKGEGQTQPKTAKQQRQSLILLEEVDVLFEEDKPFWSTVFALILQSRRPVIMTCTDEDALPLGEFIDTALLRLSPPSLSCITDHLLCIAANEGHLLSRSAVTSTIMLRKRDLRGSIMDLQFWCQMALGDDKCGIGWFLEANAANKDRKQGEPPFRMVSQGTLSQCQPIPEQTDDCCSALEHDARLLGAIFDLNNYDPADWTGWRDLRSHAASEEVIREEIKSNDVFFDACSAADLFAPPTDLFEGLDTSIPALTAKQRSQYTDTYPLLQTDFKVDLSRTSQDLQFALRAASAKLPKQRIRSLVWEDLLSAALEASQSTEDARSQNRHLSCWVFEPLSETPDGNPWSYPGIPGISVLDGPFNKVAVDVAPMVRTIALSDLQLEEERNRLSELTGEPGRKGKRQRTTRAARAALEGGSKISTRKERWFPKAIDYKAVLRTAGSGWPNASVQDGRRAREASTSSLAPPSPQRELTSAEDSEDELA